MIDVNITIDSVLGSLIALKQRSNETNATEAPQDDDADNLPFRVQGAGIFDVERFLNRGVPRLITPTFGTVVARQQPTTFSTLFGDDNRTIVIRFDIDMDSDELPIREDQTLTFTIAPEAFVCQPPDAVTVDMTLTAAPPVVSRAAVKSVETVAVVTVAVSSAIGTPTVAVQQSRVGAVLAMSECKFSHSEPVGFMSSPLGLVQGDKVGKHYRGALVGNAVLFLFFLVFAAFLTLLVYNPVKNRGVWRSMGVLHLPGVMIVPIALFAQGTVYVATSLYNHGKGQYDGILSITTAVVVSIIWLGQLYFTTCGFRCKTTPRPSATDESLSKWQRLLIWIFYSDSKWVDLPKIGGANDDDDEETTTVPFKTHWQQIFYEYRSKHQWYFTAQSRSRWWRAMCRRKSRCGRRC